MTRHARNCTAGAVYTYHEKQKDTRSGGYGTLQSRVGKDSIRDFDCCCLTLQPCRNPVVTPDGYIYDKEALLEYIVHQKTEITRKTKEYEKQKRKEENEFKELIEAEQRSASARFMENEKSLIHDPSTINSGAGPSSSISNMSNGRDQKLPSFWIPNLTPASKEVKLEKPPKNVFCPMSGNPIKLKDLTEVKFTPVVDPDDKKSLIAKRNRYMCPITHDILGNSVRCAVLKTSGSVITQECLETLVKKEMIDPTNGKKLTEKDIILLEQGGTGFSSANVALKAKFKRPVLQV